MIETATETEMETTLVSPIKSILDDDLYKFSMHQAVLEVYPDAMVEYRFNNRGDQTFTKDFLEKLKAHIKLLPNLKLQPNEKKYLESLGIFKPSYIQYLENFRFNPAQVAAWIDDDSDLQIRIYDSWHSTILWEVVLMALISELYFQENNDNWEYDKEEYAKGSMCKFRALVDAGCSFADFGTRRRRSFQVQNDVVELFASQGKSNFVGTSNVYLAMKHRVKPIGTMAHEWVMGVSALSSLRYANRSMMHKWQRVYNGNLGIALTDTFGSEAFFKDFDPYLAKLYDGVRHDSGDPVEFGDKVIQHYKKMKMDPTSKTIVFSDGLDTTTAVIIEEHFKGRIKTSYGIGTNFTNDKFLLGEESKPLNMVIKLREVNGIPVVKLSDNPIKATGDEKAVEVARWTFGV